ncbi:MAG: DMT family transporter [Gammaproteobacteria bacterium]|nr:DMT family transporter [Gammaproteobacteria bacterium]
MTDEEHRQHRLGVLLVAVSAIAWSTAGFFTRLIPLDAWSTLFWRGLFGGIFIAACVLWYYGRTTVDVLRRFGWAGWTITVLGVIAQVTFICAVKLTTVANVMIIYATVPFIAAVLAWAWLREKVTARTLITSLVAICGVAIMLRGSDFAGDLWGNLLAFAMTLTFAITMVMIRAYRSVPMLFTACMSNLLTAVVALPLVTTFQVQSDHLGYLVLFSLFQMSVGYTFFTVGSRLIPAVQTALIGALETPLAPFWVWLAFGEVPSTHSLIGGAIVVTAVITHVLVEKRRRVVIPPIP